ILEEVQIDTEFRNLEIGDSFDVTAVGVYDDGTSRELTDKVAITAETQDTVSISGNTVTAESAGYEILTVTGDNFSERLEVNVKSPTSVGYDIQLDDTSIFAGESTNIQAFENFNDGSRVDVTSQVLFSTEDVNVARVDGSVVTVIAVGF